MLSVLSPAKTLDLESRLPTRKHSTPRLLEESEKLIEVMVTKTAAEVSSLMHISQELGELNAQRYIDFTLPFTPKNARPAALVFAGDVYQGLAARSFDARDFTEAQKTVRILSGLYGVLRPLDLMQPYRLEMGTRLRTSRGASLYDFWGDTITELLKADLDESPGPRVLVNLASAEYFGVVRPALLGARVVSPRFLDAPRDGEARIVSFYAKRARGAMASWLVRERVRSVRAMYDFEADGYRYAPERSTPDQPTYVRVAA